MAFAPKHFRKRHAEIRIRGYCELRVVDVDDAGWQLGEVASFAYKADVVRPTVRLSRGLAAEASYRETNHYCLSHDYKIKNYM